MFTAGAGTLLRFAASADVMDMVVIGGVPGAGKSTAMLRYADTPEVLVLDPDTIRERVPWRPAVHALHQALVWATALLGPRLVGVVSRGRAVLVHDTATRPGRREAFLRLARWRGWAVRLLLVEVGREAALAGQSARGRLVDDREFARHWRRWEHLRHDLRTVDGHGEVAPLLVPRPDVERTLCAIVGSPTGAARADRAPAGRVARVDTAA